MMEAARRGACPSLSAPMTTGDGLLVRLNPRGGAITAGQLAGMAQASSRHGNAMIEITARGNLQIRGLAQATMDPFAEDILALDIVADEGVETRTNPLAGRDALEIADPRPLAQAVREGIAARQLGERLAPKVSIVADGGGVLGLNALAADVRLEAAATVSGPQWRVSVAGNASERVVLGQGEGGEAVEAALDCLSVLAGKGRAARARELPAETFAPCASNLVSISTPSMPRLPETGRAHPVGVFALRDGLLAHSFALPFGQASADVMITFASGLEVDQELRLAPGRGLMVLGIDAEESRELVAHAVACGLVSDRDDPRLRISACAGAPACASAHLQTKAIAAALADQFPGILESMPMMHISGCAKKCAQPAGPAVSLVGSPSGSNVECGDTAVADAARQLLMKLAERFAPEQRRST